MVLRFDTGWRLRAEIQRFLMSRFQYIDLIFRLLRKFQ
jgi:hypothetical protein